MKNRLFFKIAFTALFALAPLASFGQAKPVTPYSLAQLVKTACIFDTMLPANELPRSHAAFKAFGLPTVVEKPNMGMYGDPAGTFFISTLTDDDNIACSAVISIADMDRSGYQFLVQEISALFSNRYGPHMHSGSGENVSWIAKHGDGTRTALTINFHKKNGTDISSVASLDD